MHAPEFVPTPEHLAQARPQDDGSGHRNSAIYERASLAFAPIPGVDYTPTQEGRS